MAHSDITKPTINDSINEVLDAIGELIDKFIKSGSLTDGQTLTLVTQDGTNTVIKIGKARSGILSGMGLTWTGPLAADIEAGNFQTAIGTDSFGSPEAISFAARHATLPRIDLVSADVPASITVTTGTPSVNPQPPTIPAGHAPIHLVWIDPVTALAPADFVIGSFVVDDLFPKDGMIGIANGAIEHRLPVKPKSVDFDATAPSFDGDIINLYTNAGGFTVDLPDPTNYEDRSWLFIDVEGALSGNNVVFDATANGAFTINGVSDVTISTNYQQYRITVINGAFYGQ